jgi:hypothetical protein
MRGIFGVAAAVGLGLALAIPARADGVQRDIQGAVDGYLAGQTADAALVGGPGSAGYDSGFWIRGGDFSLKINLTLQARYEAFDWDDVERGDVIIGGPSTSGAGDLSGFSLPRAIVKFSGTAGCSTCYYLELDFGHFGRDVVGLEGEANGLAHGPSTGGVQSKLPNLAGTYYSQFDAQSNNFDNTREAWIEWCGCESFNVRMGQVMTPNTRQLLTRPELQQFVDVSLASAFTGHLMPGYTDRNRDHGILVHGAMGCNGAWTWMAAITNGEGGDSIRNVLDDRTDDNLAYSARINWAFLKPIHYEEGALRQTTCEWYGEVGAWGHYFADRSDKPHRTIADNLTLGLDLALGYGGFSFTGAFTMMTQADLFINGGNDVDYTLALAQLGYMFPGTAWEIAARWSSVTGDDGSPLGDATLTEIAGVVNYYLNGHGNKMSLDVTMLDETDRDLNFFDAYTGIQPLPGVEDSALLIRFQWQLAL